MWTKVEINDIDLLDRWVAIMRKMDQGYRTLDLNKLRNWMVSSTGHTLYYSDSDCEIALRFQYIPKRNRYQLYNVGFVGTIEPRAALDIVVARFQQFLRARDIESVLAIRPKNMDDPGIEQFHRLVPSHPRLVVSVAHDSPSAIMWNVGYRDINLNLANRVKEPQAVCG